MKSFSSFILLGSNLGDRFLLLQKAKELIKARHNSVVMQSSIYETAAWGKKNQPNFLNQVIQIQTCLNPEQLLIQNLEIEKNLGRVRLEKMDARTIDIDILLYENEIIDTSNLQIPHPRMQLRKFVLMPLNEIAPNFIHPIFKQTINQLLHQCQDTLDVKKF